MALPPRTLPGTSLTLSPVGLGLWALGGQWWGKPTPVDVAIATIRASVEAGCTWVDTAPLYGHGRADELLRQALGTNLRQVVVATKVGVRLPGPGQHAWSDLSPAYIAEDCEASLRRLGLECLDLLQVHWPCERGTPLEDSLGALSRLQEQGKVRHFGLCNFDATSLAQARALAPVASLQTPYSLLRREFEGFLRQACQEPPLGVLVYEPLCRGLLSGRFVAPPSFPPTDQRSWDERFAGARVRRALALVADLRRVAARVGLPVSAVAIGWTLHQPGVACAIAGARSPEQARQNAQAAALGAKAAEVVSRIAALHPPG